MPMQATLSLWGLYQYDNTLLDGLKAAVPTGVDADNVADTLLLESTGLEILYSNPVFMKTAVTVWANEKRDIWQKLYDTTLLEYNPIDNYDRYETSTREVTGTGETGSTAKTVIDGTQQTTASSSSTATNVVDGTQTTTGTTSNTENVDYDATSSGTNSVTNSNTSYDSDTLKVTGKSETTGSNTDSRTTDTKSSGSSSSTTDTDTTTTDTASGNSSSTTDNDTTTTDTTSGTSEFSNTDSFTSHIHGNIGVTTAMKMITEQRDVVQFCITEFICNEFLDKFTVGVY